MNLALTGKKGICLFDDLQTYAWKKINLQDTCLPSQLTARECIWYQGNKTNSYPPTIDLDSQWALLYHYMCCPLFDLVCSWIWMGELGVDGWMDH